jgi:hypothetical protein
VTSSPSESPGEDREPLGRIVTFYSYKGGTGRSMALANVAWILASHGHRVLAIDWDLEAPGLHRYFQPLLADDEMTESPGLIDFFVHFVEATRIRAANDPEASSSDRSWFEERADLGRYAVPLDYEFPSCGTLDLVSAGQQGPSYGGRVNSFQWGEFYEKLGGGIFLESMKAQLRAQYDYVLIDSRTGLSDTSGICTVQMPDELVVCFTFNRQSIYGAAATASSADAQRRLKTGEQGLRIWPVPCRVELAEKDRLEAARQVAKEKFAPFLWHIPTSDRQDYWGAAEVLYFPYYAYEEVLATIADIPKNTASLLNCMERLTARLTARDPTPVTSMQPLGARERYALLARFQPVRPVASSTPPRSRKFFLSYAKSDDSIATVRRLGAALDRQFGRGAVYWDERMPLGTKWSEWHADRLTEADTLLAVIGQGWIDSRIAAEETSIALKAEKLVIPLVRDDSLWNRLPHPLADRSGLSIGIDPSEEEIQAIVTALAESDPAAIFELAASPIDVDDPQRGQWGGRSEVSGRRLSAEVREVGGDWFDVTLTVEGTSQWPLEGSVEFYLHPSFQPSKVVVPVEDGRALLRQRAWGAYTVGVATDGGSTRLELNLAELPDAPEVFRAR